MPDYSNEFVDYVVELMAEWATVAARRMFGGYGLYREGLMFALIVDRRVVLQDRYGKRGAIGAVRQPAFHISESGSSRAIVILVGTG